jgi:hypothetical protein
MLGYSTGDAASIASERSHLWRPFRPERSLDHCCWALPSPGVVAGAGFVTLEMVDTTVLFVALPALPLVCGSALSVVLLAMPTLHRHEME